MSEVQPTIEQVISLPSGGPIPGIPGPSHAPGTYLVNWQTRTIKRVVDGVPVDEREAGTASLTAEEEEELAQQAAEKKAAEQAKQGEIAHLEAEVQTLEGDQSDAPPAGTEA